MLCPVPQAVLQQIPPLHTNERAGTAVPDIPIHLHLFVAGCDWWIAEYNGNGFFWGFVNLGDDFNAEWGSIPRSDLDGLGFSGPSDQVGQEENEEFLRPFPLVLAWDANWNPKPFREVQWRKRR